MADYGLLTPMMASDFAPTFLSPVGYGIVELHRLLIDFRVQAFTLSQPLRWAFGYQVERKYAQ